MEVVAIYQSTQNLQRLFGVMRLVVACHVTRMYLVRMKGSVSKARRVACVQSMAYALLRDLGTRSSGVLAHPQRVRGQCPCVCTGDGCSSQPPACSLPMCVVVCGASSAKLHGCCLGLAGSG
eukprot:1458875-Lingulodinium_polyedra.AAC.1